MRGRAGLSVTCNSFKAALHFCYTHSSESFFYLQGVPQLSKKDPAEYDACSKFSESILIVKGITKLSFQKMTFDSELVHFISKALSDYEGLYALTFENIKVVSPEAAKALGEALKLRKPDQFFTLKLNEGDVSLIVPLMEASAVIGGTLELDDLDVQFFDTTRHFRRWTLTARHIISLQLENVRGLSSASLNLLMKGLRNVSNLKSLKLIDTRCSPGNLIILKESLAIILEKYQGTAFSLRLGNIGMNDAAVLRITELFVEYNKIQSICLNNVESSVAKRLISTRVIPNQDSDILQMQEVNFLDETDFSLLFFALKTKGICPSMILTDDCFNTQDQILLRQLGTDDLDILFL